jgi:hypothetical protein
LLDVWRVFYFQGCHSNILFIIAGVDINTQQSFEALNQRAVAVVIDPVQSVKGKVVIDCFRLINPQLMMLGQEPRQTTSNVGHLKKPSIQALIHGLNRHYYSMVHYMYDFHVQRIHRLSTIEKMSSRNKC